MIGSPTRPGPFFQGEFGDTPRANTGMPIASIPGMSRTTPSVTMAATPPFFAIPTKMSPMTELSKNSPVRMRITSPGRATSSAAQAARLSRGPASTGNALPQNEVVPLTGLMR